ncbi:MAG: FadR family transcriptional regulator [Planctomycetes bacterium]|nr:FadR family transcriptional regulator [Planctomycetota bacterium]
MDRDVLHNRIIREIIARVASGSYAVHRRLPAERALCAEFDVARGTVRKALATLERLGVVRIKPNSGVYVQGVASARLPRAFLPPDFARVDLTDIVEARKAIELAALRRAVERISPRDLRRLRVLADRMEAALHDLPAFLELDLTFHQVLVRASGNAVLATAFEAIYEYHRFSAVYTSQQEGEEAEALACHRRLLAAIEKGDVRISGRVLGRHLDAINRYSAPRRARAPTVRAVPS